MPPPAKACTACGERKLLGEFYGDASKKFGVSSQCIECIKMVRKERRKRPEERQKALERQRKWRAENRDHRNQYNKDWREANPEATKRHQDDYRARHPDRVREARELWAEKNPDKVRELARLKAERRRSTPKGRLEAAIKAGVYIALKAKKGSRKTFDILGYTADDLMRHLEKKFKPGMTWENYGRDGWEVDHIVPLSVHNYETAEDVDFKKAWALSNLQPLWMTENRKKNARLDAPFQPSLALA